MHLHEFGQLLILHYHVLLHIMFLKLVALGNTMFDYILKRMRNKIRNRQYVMTLHAEEEMDDDELSIYDIERCVLTGEIIERQKDTVTKEWKYVIEGQSVSGDQVGTVIKLSLTGKLIIITVYLV